MNRRNFLKYGVGAGLCSGMSSMTMLSTITDLYKTSALGTKGYYSSSYKALVCVLLSGGNDSCNMLIPRGNEEYSDYANSRSNLAIPQNNILPIANTTQGGKELGLHPNMSAIKTLYDNGKVAFLSNVGTLIEPIANAADLVNRRIPLRLQSHSTQVEQWMTSLPQTSASVGWGGRTADLLSSLHNNSDISMNISLEGRNIFQSSNNIAEYTISNNISNSPPIDPIVVKSNSGFLNLIRETSVDSLVGASYKNVLEQTIANITGPALRADELFNGALATLPPFSTVFDDATFAQDLKTVAMSIAARDALQMNRQIFFVKLGGFDTHSNFNMHANLMAELSSTLSTFYTALEELGVQDDVVTFTISDFGRTLTSNGNGSDHAWGGHAMVMGGAVNGGEVYGDYPDLYRIGNPRMAHASGRLIPTISCDEYFAELISWFGVANNDLPFVLPNIGNFYSVSSTTPPIGFLL